MAEAYRGRPSSLANLAPQSCMIPGVRVVAGLKTQVRVFLLPCFSGTIPLLWTRDWQTKRLGTGGQEPSNNPCIILFSTKPKTYLGFLLRCYPQTYRRSPNLSNRVFSIPGYTWCDRTASGRSGLHPTRPGSIRRSGGRNECRSWPCQAWRTPHPLSAPSPELSDRSTRSRRCCPSTQVRPAYGSTGCEPYARCSARVWLLSATECPSHARLRVESERINQARIHYDPHGAADTIKRGGGSANFITAWLAIGPRSCLSHSEFLLLTTESPRLGLPVSNPHVPLSSCLCSVDDMRRHTLSRPLVLEPGGG